MSEWLRKVQLTQLGALNEMDRICKENNISYYLGQGTLLGAAKYHNFIPWDDDVDLLVPYKDLKKLTKIFPEQAKESYFITNYKIEKYFPLSWTKIRVKNTLSRPKRYKDIPIQWGICIDLFPIYSVSNCKILRKLEYIAIRIVNKMLMAEFTKYEENHSFGVRLLEKIPICVRHFCCNVVTKILEKHKDDTEYVMVSPKGFKICKRSLIFGKETQLSFEGKMYPVPSNYDTYLRLNYGDYMAPLPKEEQKGHDLLMGEIEWKLPDEMELKVDKTQDFA